MKIFSLIALIFIIAFSPPPIYRSSCGKIIERVAMPEMSVPGGIYNSAQDISISCRTEGAIIRYSFETLFVEKENTSYYRAIFSPLGPLASIYKEPIHVDSSVIIGAQAYKKGVFDSPEIWVTYIIHEPLSTPRFSLKNGIYITPQTVTITSISGGSKIHYTTDGSEPTEASPVYNYRDYEPITINATTILKAKAFQKGYPASKTAIGIYTIMELGNIKDVQ